METCPNCNLTHERGDASGATWACFDAQAEAMKKLLELIAGPPGSCRGCQKRVYWVTHKNGKRTPYTPAGLNHFIDCPAAAQFGKGAER